MSDRHLKSYKYAPGCAPDFKLTFKNASPRFFAYYIEKYQDCYFQAKELAKIGKLDEEKLQILKKQGARRAMARFMESLPDESDAHEDDD